MRIEWLGHSCFLLSTTAGSKLVTDPYDAGHYGDRLEYKPVGTAANVVTRSHSHMDHGDVAAVAGSPVVIDTAISREAAGFTVFGVSTFHDRQQGAQRGNNIAFVIRADGVTVCHLGDIGHELSAGQIEELGKIDVLLMPVGGTFTVDADAATNIWHRLAPAITIPMHFRNDKCHFEIDGVEPFLEGKPDVETPGTSHIDVTQEKLSGGPKIIVLSPSR
jgi:L-ascorbate metabolism protein UlaG (beta-lactamase superfamily)